MPYKNLKKTLRDQIDRLVDECAAYDPDDGIVSLTVKFMGVDRSDSTVIVEARTDVIPLVGGAWSVEETTVTRRRTA